MSILFVLIAILLPALSAVRSSAKRLICSANIRTVVGEFSTFVDGTHPLGRGESESLGPRRIQIDDFQELLYRIDEFWDQGTAKTAELSSERDAMLCPAGTATLQRRRGYPCGREALGPLGDVSVALNMRLDRPVVNFRGKNVLAPTASSYLTARILDHPYAPLAMDVDAKAMTSRGIEPFYVAPSVKNTEDPYSQGRYWAPSSRHGRSVNVGFIGGHVLASQRPAEERWDWSYQAEAR